MEAREQCPTPRNPFVPKAHIGTRKTGLSAAKFPRVYLFNISGQTRPELVAGRWFRPEITDELGDLLYSLCLLAEVVGVDLDEAFQAMLHKYEQRRQAKGHIGSQILD